VVVVGGWGCETEGALGFVFSFCLTSGWTDNLRLTKFDTRHLECDYIIQATSRIRLDIVGS